MQRGNESRVLFLKQNLTILGMHDSLRAVNLSIKEMCSEKGFSRDDGTHYYYHNVDVTQKIVNFFIDRPTVIQQKVDLITASPLHDFAEDIHGFTIETIARMFNPRVAEIVDKVTKKKELNYKKPEVLEEYLRIIEEDEDAALLKTADRIHNFSTLGNCTIEKQLKQSKETREHFFPFFKRCRNRYPEYARFFLDAKTAIEPHLKNIEESHKRIQELETIIQQLQQENQQLRSQQSQPISNNSMFDKLHRQNQFLATQIGKTHA